MENRLPKEGWYTDNHKEVIDYLNDTYGIEFKGRKDCAYGVGNSDDPFYISAISARQITNLTKLSIEEFVEMTKTVDKYWLDLMTARKALDELEDAISNVDDKPENKIAPIELIMKFRKKLVRMETESLISSVEVPSLESINISLASIYMFKNKYYPESYPSEKDIEAMYNCIHKDKACAMFEELCNMFPVYGLSKRVEILTEFLDSHNLPHDPTETFTLTDTGDFRRHFHKEDYEGAWSNKQVCELIDELSDLKTERGQHDKAIHQFKIDKGLIQEEKPNVESGKWHIKQWNKEWGNDTDLFLCEGLTNTIAAYTKENYYRNGILLLPAETGDFYISDKRYSIRLATDKEIEDALTAEFHKKYEGKTFNSIDGVVNNFVYEKGFNTIKYFPPRNALYVSQDGVGGQDVFRDGVWVDIIEEPKELSLDDKCKALGSIIDNWGVSIEDLNNALT